MNSGCGTKNETLSKVGVSDKLSDDQLLEKFNIKKCSVILERLKSSEYDAAVIKSSSQKITECNRPFDLNGEFQGSQASGKQNEHNVGINPVRIARKLTYYGTGPDIVIVKEIPFLSVNTEEDTEEEASWKKGLIIEKMDIREHLNRYVPEIEEDMGKCKSTFPPRLYNRSRRPAKFFKRNTENIVETVKAQEDMAKCKSTSPLHLNNRSNQSAEILKRNTEDIVETVKAQDDMAKCKSTSPLHLNNRNNQSAEILKRNAENIVETVEAQRDILKKQVKRPKRNNQNTAVKRPKRNNQNTAVKRPKRNNQNTAVKRPKRNNQNTAVKRPKRNNQNTAVQAISDSNQERKKTEKRRDTDRMNHGSMIKNESISQTKTSQLHLNNRIDPKFLKIDRRRMLERYRMRHKRSYMTNPGKAVMEKKIYYDLRKKYGIKECFVVISQTPEIRELIRRKSFKVHYGQDFLKSIAQQAYSVAGLNVDLDELYKETRLSQFSSLSQKGFKRVIWGFIKHMFKCESFIKKRLENIARDQGKLDEQVTRRKMWYNNRNNENDHITVEDRNIVHKLIRKLLINIKYPLVLADRNEIAAYLARKLAQQNKIDHEKSQQPNCNHYNECHSEKEFDHTQMSKISLKMGEKLQDLNDDGKENHTGKQPLIFDSQQDIETETMQNDDNDASSYVSSKQCESVQYHLPVKCHQTAVTETDCIPFQLTDNNKNTDTRNALKEVTYDASPECNPLSLDREISQNMKPNDDASENKIFSAENECNPPTLSKEIPLHMEHIDNTTENLSFEAASKCNPPSLSREIPLGMEHVNNASENLSLRAANEYNSPTLSRETPPIIVHFDDASENKGCNAANDNFFVIDDADDSDSDFEKKSCVSYSEECSGADQQS